MNFSRVLLSHLPVAFCVLTFAVGCGGGSDAPDSEEPQKVAAVVSGLNDAAGSDETFSSVFVGGQAPEDRDKYYSTSIEIIGIPEVSGDTATAVIKISQGNAESEGNSDTKATDVSNGEVTWSLKKEGGEWKIQDAPLP